jgi:hypothetical protein
MAILASFAARLAACSTRFSSGDTGIYARATTQRERRERAVGLAARRFRLRALLALRRN